MKVLKDNYNNFTNSQLANPYPRMMYCDGCASELEYEEEDVKTGAFGCACVICPLCGESNFIDESEKVITLTKDNVEFPTHFYHTSVETGAVDLCDNKNVRDAIRKGINYFRNNKDETDWMYACGNLYVGISRFDGDENYNVIVTENYYETDIPFEAADY